MGFLAVVEHFVTAVLKSCYKNKVLLTRIIVNEQKTKLEIEKHIQ